MGLVRSCLALVVEGDGREAEEKLNHLRALRYVDLLLSEHAMSK
jgi:hypothetical protein